ncbi:hypothetical protein M271_01330 [Streptomyces rapamycinicus NRRL 5491]|nr:hypothetical protein M271_01330 [Streptomyces rapamycinicus NRRL 5491]
MSSYHGRSHPENTTALASLPAVVTTITGRAWLTGTAQFFLDPEDPFPEGCYL